LLKAIHIINEKSSAGIDMLSEGTTDITPKRRSTDVKSQEIVQKTVETDDSQL